jgi:hypothetical protein
VLILGQMGLALVILEDPCSFKHCRPPLILSFFRFQKLTPALPCGVSPDRVEALRNKAISGRLAGITVLTQLKYVL